MTQISASCTKHCRSNQETLPPHYEIDAVEDEDFGTLYRLWEEYHFLGTFYQDVEGYWIPQPCNSDYRPQLQTELQAQLVIVEFYENQHLQAA